MTHSLYAHLAYLASERPDSVHRPDHQTAVDTGRADFGDHLARSFVWTDTGDGVLVHSRELGAVGSERLARSKDGRTRRRVRRDSARVGCAEHVESLRPVQATDTAARSTGASVGTRASGSGALIERLRLRPARFLGAFEEEGLAVVACSDDGVLAGECERDAGKRRQVDGIVGRRRLFGCRRVDNRQSRVMS